MADAASADDSDPKFGEKLDKALARKFSTQELRQIEASWKSDVDKKLDRLVKFANAYEMYLKLCLERELDKKILRQAVIQKTTIGLVWLLLGILGMALWNYFLKQISIK